MKKVVSHFAKIIADRRFCNFPKIQYCKEARLERADFPFQLLMFVTTNGKIYTFFLLFVSCCLTGFKQGTFRPRKLRPTSLEASSFKFSLFITLQCLLTFSYNCPVPDRTFHNLEPLRPYTDERILNVQNCEMSGRV